MEETDIDFILEQLDSMTRWIQKLQEGLASISDHLIETKQYVAEIHTRQKDIAAKLVDIERLINSESGSMREEVLRNRSSIESLARTVKDSENGITLKIDELEKSVSELVDDLARQIAKSLESTSSHIDRLDSDIQKLGEEVSMTKSLATYIRADIRSLTHELKEGVKAIEEKDERRQKELEGKIDSLQNRLEEVLGEYEKLLDVHTEKLLTLQAEVMTLRETVLKDFGEVFTKLEILMYKERMGGEGNE